MITVSFYHLKIQYHHKDLTCKYINILLILTPDKKPLTTSVLQLTILTFFKGKEIILTWPNDQIWQDVTKVSPFCHIINMQYFIFVLTIGQIQVPTPLIQNPITINNTFFGKPSALNSPFDPLPVAIHLQDACCCRSDHL